MCQQTLCFLSLLLVHGVIYCACVWQGTVLSCTVRYFCAVYRLDLTAQTFLTALYACMCLRDFVFGALSYPGAAGRSQVDTTQPQSTCVAMYYRLLL